MALFVHITSNTSVLLVDKNSSQLIIKRRFTFTLHTDRSMYISTSRIVSCTCIDFLVLVKTYSILKFSYIVKDDDLLHLNLYSSLKVILKSCVRIKSVLY